MAVYLLCYGASFLFARIGYHGVAGIGLISAAIYLYWKDYEASGNMIHLRGLFSLSWVGGQGLACLKLSKLGMDWETMTWICFLAAYLGFYVTYQLLTYYKGDMNEVRERWKDLSSSETGVFLCACGLTAISFFCFLIEAMFLGYIPLFLRGVPHAYSYFHLTGIHYITVSCVIVPALSVIYFCSNKGRNRKKTLILLAADIVALGIPILCVSRFQIILAIFLAVLTYLQVDRRLNIWYAAGAFAALIPLYLLLTVARSHDVSYLNRIFEMKYSRMPICLSQPYTYISNNYDNFNCMVERLGTHSFGIRMTAPFWTLSGLKFLFPFLTKFPIFVTKEELTTLTLFYDAYYDFGLIGVFLFSCGLGALSYYLMGMVKHIKNPIGYLFYAQIAMYLLLSFFTTWFSNPTTWFYLAVTAVAAFVTEHLGGTEDWVLHRPSETRKLI